MSFICDKITQENQVLSICKITHLAWNDDQVDSLLGVIEARIRLRAIPFAEVFKLERCYLAIPLSQVPCQRLKRELGYLKCVVGQNVFYKNKTHRSLLIPKVLLRTDAIADNEIHSVVSLRPEPHFVFVSENQYELWGKHLTNHGQLWREMEDMFICGMHQFFAALNVPGSSKKPDVSKCCCEFSTPRGAEMYECTFEATNYKMCIITFTRQHGQIV